MIEDYWVDSHPTGSSYICDPPVTDTDIDTVVLVNMGDLDMISEIYLEEGWTLCGYDEYGHDTNWYAMRKGKENHIVTDDAQYYDSFVEATEEAKRLNLLKKEDRIALFNKYLNRDIEFC